MVPMWYQMIKDISDWVRDFIKRRKKNGTGKQGESDRDDTGE